MIRTERKNIYILKYIALMLVVLLPYITKARGTEKKILKGVILNQETKEPLPFVNVWIKGTTIGTASDINGAFQLNYDFKDATLITFSFVGFQPQEKMYKDLTPNNALQILLKEEKMELEEVQVKPDNTYARSIIKSIVKNRKINNPDNFSVVNYNEYSRKSIFLSNLNKDIKNKKSFRAQKNAFIAQTDSTVAMPIFITEKHTGNSINKKEKEHAIEILKEKSECIMPQLQNVVNTVIGRKVTSRINFYDNQINIMERGFPSPIAWNNQVFYNIYLVDSLKRDGVKQYRFDFYPKSYRSTAFKGYFWIDSETYALTEIHAKLPLTANVNFVNSFEAHQYFQQTAKHRWFFKGQKLRSQLSISKNKSKTPDKKRVNVAVQNIIDYYNVWVPGKSGNVFVTAQSLELSRKAIESYKPVPLDSLEVKAYAGIKELKSNKMLRQISKFSDMTLTGYYNLGKIDLGSYMDIYRKNEIEGNRWTLPLRTNKDFCENFSIGGYVGYGLKSKEVKYGANIHYKLPFKTRTILSVKYNDDYYALTNYRFVDFIRENPFEAGGGNVVSSITTRVPNPYMLNLQKFSVNLEYQMLKDIGLTVRPFYEKYNASQFVQFRTAQGDVKSFNNIGVLADLRFSFGQPYDEGFFYRVYYGNQKPVIHLSAIAGQASFKQNNKTHKENYLQLNATLKNRISLGPAYMRMLFNAGYIAGKVPYPLLYMPRGTRDLGFARYHYNLLHNSSFASDLYTNVHLSFNGGGSFFGKIPLLKRLNLRESISFKSFWGKLSNRHNDFMEQPNFLRAPTNKPYMEIGFGITNIFKVLRVEYVRRLNRGAEYDQFSSKDGIRFRIEVSF